MPFSCWLALGFFSAAPPTPHFAIGREAHMEFDYALGALVTAGLLVYLIYALIRPERF